MNTKMKLRFFFVFLLLLGLKAQLVAQESSLLWKISGNGLAQDSYLFGTIHIICADQFVMDERIQEAFDQSDQIILELDMDDPQLQAQMQQMSINPQMKNISQDLSEEDAGVIDAFLLEKYGAGLQQLGILKPFVLSSMVLLKSLPCEQIESYENYLTNRAQETSKPLIGLETVAFQMGVFDQIPQKTQLDELVKMIKEESADDEFEKLIKAYQSEDMEALFEAMNNDGFMEEYRDLILDSRNKAWIPIMEKEMANQSVFVAVGGGHLGGENGVIALLRKQGYTVTPIK
ncbi:MAG: TraB/GumN family protein [Cytophagales bacterium]|uniref:TraB/GumN family protein n=1 Tax=Algoriphagus taiwanensis TaxID=1445656 RepID=A0ABQ6Q5F4_9BACT|nr:MAG: TraB/GumN family protein [Cytophagales bacterium]GMQ35405.1 TraB/GumN family protein [Algoriphagus taiwanensis]